MLTPLQKAQAKVEELLKMEENGENYIAALYSAMTDVNVQTVLEMMRAKEDKDKK